MAGKPRSLSELLDQLSIVSTTSKRKNEAVDQLSIESTTSKRKNEAEKIPAFQAELNKTKFTIFAPLSDCGYFGWKSEAPSSNKSEDSDFFDDIDLQQKPKQLVPIYKLRVPQRFYDLPPFVYPTIYPFGQSHVASLYVATRHRGVSLKEIDFVVGGSTLEMLARRDDSDTFLATLLPFSENTVLVARCKDYVQDFSVAGFQFERLVTGLAMNRPSLSKCSEHLHTMRIGGQYNVLFCTETDAMDGKGEAVEVTASNPRYWGTRTMFQLISNRCPTLCHGIKTHGEVKRIDMIPLSSVANDALKEVNHSMLENNILIGMKNLKEQMLGKEVGYVYGITFDSNGMLKLTLTTTEKTLSLSRQLNMY